MAVGAEGTAARPRSASARDYLPYVGLLVVLSVLGVARRDLADVNTQDALEAKVAVAAAAVHEQRDYGRGARLLGEVLAGSPEHYLALIHMAAALEGMRQIEAARQTWARVYEMAEARRDVPMMKTARQRLSTQPRAAGP